MAVTGCVTTQQQCCLINRQQNSPWIQGRREHQSFRTHQWRPEHPLGQGHRAHRGHPVKQAQKDQAPRNYHLKWAE